MNSQSNLTQVLEAQARPDANTYGGTDGPDFTQYGLLVLSLLGTIGLLAWVFKRMVGGTLKRRAEERALQISDVLPLSNKQRLCVVRCYDRSFFLGVSDKQVDLIAELDAAAIGQQASPAPAAPGSPIAPEQKEVFLRALKKVHAEHLAASANREVVVKPTASKKRAARKPVARQTATAPQQAAPRKVRKPAAQPAATAARRARLDDGRGMLA